VKFSDYVYFVRNFDLFIHNLKTLRLAYFRLRALVTLSKNSWPRVLGSVVIQLYAGECTPSVVRAKYQMANNMKFSRKEVLLNSKSWKDEVDG